MPNIKNIQELRLKIRRYALVLMAVWTALVLGLLGMDVLNVIRVTDEIALYEGRAYLSKDEAMSFWSVSHGGVYVATDYAGLTPDIYTDNVPEKIIKTPFGKILTRVTPGYMIRRINENFQRSHGVKARVTSLIPTRPENAPDDWEQKALNMFEKGVMETHEFFDSDGERYLRIMRPVYTKEECLQCHAQQGYKIGDIRGGIDITLPMRHFAKQEREQIMSMSFSRSLIWALGILGLVLGTRNISRRIEDKEKVEMALAESERRFRDVIENVKLAAVMMDTKGDLTFVNEFLLELTGWKKNQVLGRNWFDVFLPDDSREEIRKMFTDGMRNGSIPYNFENEILTKNGSRKILTWNNIVLRDPMGQVIGSTSIGEDVTERKKAEEEIHRQHQFLRNVLEALTHPFYVIDAQTYEIIMANSAASKGGLTPGIKCYQLNHNREDPCSGEDHPCPIDLIRDTREPIIMKHIHYDAYGRELYVEVHGYPVTDASGEVTQVIEYTLDITAREIAERELRASRKRFKDLVENIAEAIIEINGEGQIEIWNKAAENIFGYAAEEIVGNVMEFIISDESVALFRSAVTESLGIEDAMQTVRRPVELVGLRKDGATFPAELAISISKYERDTIHFTCILRDLTEMKKNQERLIRAESLSTVGTFISGIAHELNNPLTAVLGFSENVMEEPGMPESAKEDLEIIVGEVRRSVGILRNLLNFVRKKPAEKRPVDLNDAMKSVLDLKKYQFRVDDITVEADLQPHLPLVYGDFSQLRQVILNIVQNAHHAIQDTHRHGRVTLSSRGRDDMVTIEITNNGGHIPEEVLPKIFEPFFTTKKGERGTGLGLAITSSIIQNHHGVISVENIDDGVKFTITIPEYIGEEKDIFVSETGKLPHGEGKKVLIIDDEMYIRSWLSKYFRKRGFVPMEAANGLDAVYLLEKDTVDVIVMDLRMPRMDGYDFYSVLKDRWPEYLNRIIIATGVIEEKVIHFANDTGCEMLEKPFNQSRADEAVFNVLKRI